MAVAPAIMIGAVVLSAAIAGYSTYRQMENQKAQAKAQKNAMEYDAELRDRQAKMAETAKRAETRRFVAEQRAKFAKTGALVDADSPLEVQLETASLGELDALTAGYQSRIGAAQARHGARIADWERKEVSRTQTIATGLSAAGAAASTYSGFSKGG